MTDSNTRNCILSYPDKQSMETCLSWDGNGAFVEGDQDEKANGTFYFGDNLSLLHLLRPQYQGMVDLIYIDPPFGTGKSFVNIDQEVAYKDQILDYEFLEFLRKRLYVMREWLSDRGSIYLHIDKKIGHYVKLIMDEVFGYENFLNDISRIKCNPKNFSRKAYGNYSDMILLYAKHRDQHIWHETREALQEDEIKKLFPKISPSGDRYTTHPLHAPGETKDGDTGKSWKGLLPPKGRHWRYGRAVLDELDAQGLIEWSATGNPRKIVYAKDHPGKKVQDVWEFKDRGLSYVAYPTQKNHELLRRILLQSSEPDSLILDAFAGSGGTLLIAEELGRRWIGMDQSEQALNVIQEQMNSQGIQANWLQLVS
ncbi:MAG: site-specific DNA-methyltransferase [Bacteroidota bacterium]